jgi:hypothetical protein
MRFKPLICLKLSRLVAGPLFYVVVILVSSAAPASVCLAQSKAPYAVNTTSTLNAGSVPENTYFDAQGRSVSSPTSLGSEKVSATSSGNFLSLLFDTARVSLQTERDPLVATWIGTIVVPTTAGNSKRLTLYSQDVRGSITKTADTQVTVFLELGGQNFVLRFPYGTQFDGDLSRRFVSLANKRSRARYVATVMIIAERRGPKDALLVDIDALDIEAKR